jgi:hypothetical protein
MTARSLWRWPLGVALLFAAVLLHSGLGPGFGASLGLWFLAALAIGVLAPRWEALALAVLPWPLGIGLGLATERFIFLSAAWQAAATLSALVGFAGIALGVALARRSPGRVRGQSVPPYGLW